MAIFVWEGRTAQGRVVKGDNLEAPSLEAALARLQRAVEAGIIGQDLAHQEDLIATPRDALARDLFRAPMAVHLGGIDVRQAEVDAGAQRVRGAPLRIRGTLDLPRALSDQRNLHASPPERPIGHHLT